ncbi:MAG: family 16 glycosylhydrolase, partial [Clostridia bacterium]|nr:family 16 glycosylhydrolase [Clostridia bacterium]
MKKIFLRVLSCALMVTLLLSLATMGVSVLAEETPKTDLAITGITWNGGNQPKPGKAITFTVKITNKGAEIAKGTSVPLWLYMDGKVLFSETYDKGFAAGQTTEVTLPKWKATAGDHVVTAVINSNAIAAKSSWDSGLHYTTHIRVGEKALAVPEIAQTYGMDTLVFSDDFKTLDTIDVDCTGGYGYKWYTQRPYGAKDMLPTDYVLTENGVRLQQEIPSFNWGFCTLDPKTGVGWGYQFGYLEVRLKVAANRVIPDTKGSPAVWSFPPEKVLNDFDDGPHTWVEMDWMEYWGNNKFTTCFHDSLFVESQETCRIDNTNISAFGLGDEQWHTMGFLWRDGTLECFLDGEEYMSQYWSGEEKPYPDAFVKTGEGEYTTDGAFESMDSRLLSLILGSGKGWPMEIDYITVWQGDAEASKGESTQTAMFMDCYLRDSDGQINTAVNFERYETLLMIEESLTELPAEQQAEINRVVKRKSGKTLSEVLEDAKQFKDSLEQFIAQYATDSEGNILSAENID